MILSLVNVKGGVGKTTTAVNLAAVFAHSDLKVLLIDLDPQGSASASMGVPEEDMHPSMADVLLNGTRMKEAVMESGIAGLDLATGTMELAGADLKLARKPEAHRRLGKALQYVRRNYDVIVIDCPPGLGLLSANALVVSDAYILPVVPHELAAQALDRFFEGLESLEPLLGEEPELLGILLTMVDKRTKLSGQVSGKIRRKYSGDVFRASVPINARLALAPRHGMTIFEFERWSPGARAYSEVGAEAITRARQARLI